MTDPFRPLSYRERAPQRAPDLPPLIRLRRAGLTAEDEAEVRERWAAMTNAQRFEAMAALDNLDDEELRRQVVEMREEMREEAEAAAALVGYADSSPDEVPDGTAQEVLGWVGDDAAKAAAALAAEQARPQPRKTLRSRLQALVGG
jgi:hypothetical protein